MNYFKIPPKVNWGHYNILMMVQNYRRDCCIFWVQQRDRFWGKRLRQKDEMVIDLVNVKGYNNQSCIINRASKRPLDIIGGWGCNWACAFVKTLVTFTGSLDIYEMVQKWIKLLCENKEMIALAFWEKTCNFGPPFLDGYGKLYFILHLCCSNQDEQKWYENNNNNNKLS